MTGRKIVPFRRNLRLGSRGDDCRAVKRALARAGHGRLGTPATAAPVLGPLAIRHLRAWKRTVSGGLPDTPVYGIAAHRQLVPHMDPYAIQLYTGGQTLREKVVAAALAVYAIRDRVHYTQTSRRMSIVRLRLRPPFEGTDLYEDCSSAATGLYWLTGAPDPNGRGYDGQGWTGTLCRHGKVVTLTQARKGDLVFYGAGAPWAHVAVYLGGGRVWSHGSESGPHLLEIDYRGDRGEIRSYLP